MTKHIFVHERKHPSGQEDNDFQVFIETDDDEAFPQPEGAHEYFYVGEKDDMPHGFEELAYIYDGSHGHNDTEFMARASNNFTITPSQKLANVSNSPQTHKQSDTGEIIQVPVKQAEIEVRPLTDAEIDRRIVAACRSIYDQLEDYYSYKYIGGLPTGRKNNGTLIYDATYLQVRNIAWLAMAIHRGIKDQWTHSNTDAGDTRAVISYLEGYYQDVPAILLRNYRTPVKNRKEWLSEPMQKYPTDVVTTGGVFISEPNGVVIEHANAPPNRGLSKIVARFDTLRPTETWAADDLT